MTRSSFDQWMEEHYGQLVAYAGRLVNNPEDAREVVHDAVAATLSNGHLSKVRAPWTWMTNAVRGYAHNRRTSDARRARGTSAFYAGVEGNR